MRNDAQARDVFQATFLKLHKCRDRYDASFPFVPWLFTICRNSFYRRRLREERHVNCDDPELEALAAAAVHASAQQGGYADIFARFDLSDAIERAIAKLPDAFREAVLLVDVNDQSYEAAAGLLGVPVGTVRSRLFRARRLLQEALVDHARDAGLVHPGINACVSRSEP